eukprot:TRINITY_DN40798_c0_g1_i1.p1 TRINITY_DN40798_c0_g1~~TRINITY_DN40798_c0_g1_i1.p1  ORF type:complete len:508 (-),score=84.52 TRINITY_DN40798_c0_g1_i1:97-1620(-)
MAVVDGDQVVQMVLSPGGVDFPQDGMTVMLCALDRPASRRSIKDPKFVNVSGTTVKPKLPQGILKFTHHPGDDEPLRFLGIRDTMRTFAQTTLAELLAAPDRRLEVELRTTEGIREVTIVVEVISVAPFVCDKYLLQLSASALDKKDLLGKSDPYLKLSKECLRKDNFVPVLRTEHITQCLEPEWQPRFLSAVELCDNDPNKPLLCEVFDYDKGSEDDLIGTATVTLTECLAGVTLDLLHPKKVAKGKGRSGQLKLAITRFPEFSVARYLSSGLRLAVTVAIDLSANNGDLKSPHFLHRLAEPQDNVYVQAISAVFPALFDLVRTDRLLLRGFGADNNLLPCDPSNPVPQGVPGAVAAYQVALAQSGRGQAGYAPLFEAVAQEARTAGESLYTVLVILGPGHIRDSGAAVQALRAASSAPLSIVMVKTAPPTGWDLFDCTSDFLDRQGNHAHGKGAEQQLRVTRDLFQTVVLHGFEGCPDLLARELVRELPAQISRWALLTNRMPPA